MKREIKYPYKAQVIILMTVIISMFTSCLSDNFPVNEGEPGLIVMSLDGVENRGGVLFTNDSEITKVRIFVFVNDALEINRLFTAGEDSFNNPFVLEVSTGKKDIYVVANETTELSSDLSAITNRTDLKNLVIPNEITAPLTLPLTMAGEVLDVQVVNPKPGTNSVSVQLTRIAAKISLKFKKENAADDVKITKVSLLSNTGKTTLYPVPPATATFTQTFWDWVHPLATPLDVAVSETVIDGHESIYVYENLTADATDKTHATRLEIEALFNNIPTTYRVYVNETVTAPGNGTPGDPNSSTLDVADHLYKIKRNHHYVITGTIKNPGEFNGLEIIYQIMPWIVVEKAVFMGHGYNVVIDEAGNVTIKNTEAVCAPHKVELRCVGTFTFGDGSTSKIFNSLVNGHSENYTVTPVPTAGAGAYLEVWYNDVKVKTFTK